jgi:hypothetical protein
MKKNRIVLDFIRIPISQKVETGRSVKSKMTGNPKFATPDVSMEELETTTDLLETRSVAALSGGKEATALMHQTEEYWNDIMRKQARYVDRIADGDSAVILSAGFNLAKQPAPAVRPEFSVELSDKSGSVILRRQAVESAKSYIWQHCTGEIPVTDSDWTTATVTSQASTELNGLIPLTKYWFKVAAVTPTGTSAYTAPIMQVVI